MNDAGEGDGTDQAGTGTGTIWEAISVQCTPPIPARVGHSIVQTSSDRLHVFGGANEEHTLEEIWEMEMNCNETMTSTCTCTRLDTKFPGIYEFVAVPEPQSETSSASAASKERGDGEDQATPLRTDRVWVFGGGTQDSEAVKNDVLIFDTRTKALDVVSAENSPGAPTPRTQGGNKCLIEYEGSKHLAIFGGGTKNNTSEDGSLYLFNIVTRTWSKVEVTGETPQPRQGHIVASLGSKIFIHGGMLGTSLFDDMHMIDLGRSPHTWIPIKTETASNGKKPAARAAHNVATIGGHLYVFGGLDASGEGLNDLWQFNTESSEWTQIHYVGCRIEPRVDFALSSIRLPSNDTDTTSDCSDSAPDALIIHGGVNPSGVFFSDMFLIRPKP